VTENKLASCDRGEVLHRQLIMTGKMRRVDSRLGDKTFGRLQGYKVWATRHEQMGVKIWKIGNPF